jgi:hypothetical protein
MAPLFSKEGLGGDFKECHKNPSVSPWRAQDKGGLEKE